MVTTEQINNYSGKTLITLKIILFFASLLNKMRFYALMNSKLSSYT